MKLVSWNCQGGFNNKYKKLISIAPDVAVIQDCLHPSKMEEDIDYSDAVWVGNKKEKGLCVLSFSKDYKLSMLVNETKYEWIVPIKVSGNEDFVLLAIWARRMPGYSYGKLVYSALKEYEQFINKGQVIVIGDFNVDKKVPSGYSGIQSFENLIELLDSYGLTSCYHYFSKEEFGSESKANYFHYGKSDKPFHVHYCFVSQEILQNTQQFYIDESEEWSALGYHLPLVLDSTTMVHYKEDKSNGDPWVKDTNIELHRSLEEYLKTADARNQPNCHVPAIRLLPMSESDLEFTGKSIEEVQEWFIKELPYRKYNFKNGMNTDSGTLVLFQYKGHVIASAILKDKIMYDEDDIEGGYRGAYNFIPESIAVFTPITADEMREVWSEFKGFNQSLQKLNVKQYESFYLLLLRKNIFYVLHDIDEESFQKQVESISVNNSEIVDQPREKPTYFNATSQKFKRNPIFSKNAIQYANYRCEFDGTHKYFTSFRTGQNYVEAHHLIPVEFQDQFEKSIDVEANIVSLCPVCHKKVHHGVMEDKKQILIELFFNRRERLKQCGLNISEDALLSYYE